MIRTRHVVTFLSPLALTFMNLGFAPHAFTTPAIAQETAQKNDTAYEALHDAIIAASDKKAAFENTMKAIENAYRSTPEMQALEVGSPGIIAKMIEAMRPAMQDRTKRIEQLYRPALIALYKRHLTRPEARDLTTFYSSPLGRRILYQASTRYSPDATLGNLKSDGDITQEQVNADLDKATRLVLNSLSAQDQNAMAKAMRDTPALLKLRAVFDEARVLRVQMENEPPTPEEEARITTAINRVLRENM